MSRISRPALRRVAFFDPYPHLFGGSQRTTIQLAAALARRGVEVTVLTTAEGVFTERLSSAGIAWEAVRLPSGLQAYGHATTGTVAAVAAAAAPWAWIRIGAILRRLSPDVLHALDLRGVLLAGPPARLIGAPVVWHAHLTEPQPALNALAARMAKCVVLPSLAARSGLVGVRASRVCAIANAVDTEGLRAGLPAQQHRVAPGNPSSVGVCARLVPQKGIDVLVRAVAQLVERHPTLKVTVFGAPQRGYEDHHRELLRLVEHHGLEGFMSFPGAVLEPTRHLVGMTLYAQPSRFEILPLAILEAMAVGLPVVASAVGAVPEAVEHGATGLLVPPGDPTALAGALDALLRAPQRRSAMGQAGAARVRLRFSVDAMADRWMDLYGSLLDRR